MDGISYKREHPEELLWIYGHPIPTVTRRWVGDVDRGGGLWDEPAVGRSAVGMMRANTKELRAREF